jgi:hypothetical protein
MASLNVKEGQVLAKDNSLVSQLFKGDFVNRGEAIFRTELSSQFT